MRVNYLYSEVNFLSIKMFHFAKEPGENTVCLYNYFWWPHNFFFHFIRAEKHRCKQIILKPRHNAFSCHDNIMLTAGEWKNKQFILILPQDDIKINHAGTLSWAMIAYHKSHYISQFPLCQVWPQLLVEDGVPPNNSSENWAMAARWMVRQVTPGAVIFPRQLGQG